MEDEIIMVSSSKDTGGVIFFDMATTCPFSQGLKNCLCPPQGGLSSYSGKGSSCGDFIVAAQAMKPQINVWQWGKPQAVMQCHIQEITTAIAADSNGYYLLGGTKGGRLHAWDISSGNLVLSWQAHFKSITSIKFTSCGNFCVSSSEDGMVRVWDVVNIMSSGGAAGTSGTESSKKIVSPFRSWTPHSLPITGLELQASGGPCGFTRVMTVSTDRSLVVHDMFANRQCSIIALPEALTCCTSSPAVDFAYVGSCSGRIYIVTLTSSGTALTAAHAKRMHVQTADRRLDAKDSSSSSGNLTPFGTAFGRGQLYDADILLGHAKAVTGLAHSTDNITLVSVAADGDMRVWNTVTRQCLKILNPFNRNAISNVMILSRPEMVDSSGLSTSHKPNLCPFGHLKKYQQNSSSSLSTLPVDKLTGDDRAGASGHMGRRVIGYSRPHASSIYNTDEADGSDAILGMYNVDAAVERAGDGVMSEVDDLMGGDVVALPHWDDDAIAQMTKKERTIQQQQKGRATGSEGQQCDDPVALRGMLRRQDTFGDEFYENWDKVINVKSPAASNDAVEEECDGEVSTSTAGTTGAVDDSNSGSFTAGQSGKSKKGGKKRVRYHEVMKQRQEQEKLEAMEDQQRAEEKMALVEQYKSSENTVVRSTAVPPKLKRGRKK